MPYDIRRNNNAFCVVKSDTGDAVKCYRRLANAKRLLRALYANVEDADRAYRTALLSMYSAITGVTEDSNEVKRFAHQVSEAIRAEKWGDQDLERHNFVHCVPVDVERVADPGTIQVLAVPFNVVDAYNTYFTRDTLFSIGGKSLGEIPVYDTHGLRGTVEDTTPVGIASNWRPDERGLWATVRLNENDPRSAKFAEGAAQCKLGSSIGMLRAGMYPQPPLENGGKFNDPTWLQKAPIVELSLILPGDIEPANPAAIAGYQFSAERRKGDEMCKDCQDKTTEIEQQLDALRAELDKVRNEKEEAVRELAAQRAAIRAQEAALRLKPYNLPQSIVDEFLDVYNAVSMGDQNKLIEVVGKMIDHVRSVSKETSPIVNGDMRAMLVSQMLDSNANPLDSESDRLLKEDREWIKRRFQKFPEVNNVT